MPHLIYTRYIFLVVIFFLSSVTYSQKMVTVKGTVFDAKSMARLSGANLIIEDLERGTTSDENGQFILSSVPEGEFIISAREEAAGQEYMLGNSSMFVVKRRFSY